MRILQSSSLSETIYDVLRSYPFDIIPAAKQQQKKAKTTTKRERTETKTITMLLYSVQSSALLSYNHLCKGIYGISVMTCCIRWKIFCFFFFCSIDFRFVLFTTAKHSIFLGIIDESTCEFQTEYVFKIQIS